MENGTYRARPGAATIEEAKSGALMLYIMMQVDGGPNLKSSHCLVGKDGSLMTRTIDNLKKWAVGWNGADPYWFMEMDLSTLEVEVVVENVPGFTDPSKTFPEVKWVNAPGSGGGPKLPEATDKKLVLAKYGAKFRAMAGGTPAVARPPTVKPAPSAPQGIEDPNPRSAPPTRQAPPLPAAKPKGATQATAWAKLNELGAGAKAELLEEKWFGFVDATGMDQANMTPEGWASVEEAIQGAHDAGTLTLPF